MDIIRISIMLKNDMSPKQIKLVDGVFEHGKFSGSVHFWCSKNVLERLNIYFIFIKLNLYDDLSRI